MEPFPIVTASTVFLIGAFKNRQFSLAGPVESHCTVQNIVRNFHNCQYITHKGQNARGISLFEKESCYDVMPTLQYFST